MLHDYNLDPNYVASRIDGVKARARSSGQRMIYEEYGALGSSKQSQISAVTNKLLATGVPWMYWEVSHSSFSPFRAISDYPPTC